MYIYKTSSGNPCSSPSNLLPPPLPPPPSRPGSTTSGAPPRRRAPTRPRCPTRTSSASSSGCRPSAWTSSGCTCTGTTRTPPSPPGPNPVSLRTLECRASRARGAVVHDDKLSAKFGSCQRIVLFFYLRWRGAGRVSEWQIVMCNSRLGVWKVLVVRF